MAADFRTWLTQRNFGLLIIGVLLVAAIEKLGARLHEDVISPVFYYCIRTMGCKYDQANLQKITRLERVMLHVLEFAFAILVIYLLSRFLVREESGKQYLDSQLDGYRNAVRPKQ